MGLWNAIANRFGYVKRDVDPYALIPRSAKTATISDAPAWLQAEGEEEGYNIPDRMLPRAQLELYQRLSWLQIAVNHVATTAAGTGFTSIGTAWQLGGGTDLMRAEHKRITSTSAVALTETAGANVRHTSLAVILSEAGATAGTATPGAGAATAAGLIPTLERERSITNRRFLV